MGGDAVELVIRFAETLIAVTRVRPGQRFVIGKGRKVDLPLDVADRTLVDGLAVHHPDDGKFTLARGQRVDLRFGLVTIEMTRVVDHVIPLPRPEVSLRLVPFLAGALVAHVALVLVALWIADVVEPVSIPVVRAEPPRRVMTKRLPEPKPKPKPKPATRRAKTASAASTVPTPSEPAPATTVAGARQEARKAGVLSSASLDDLSAIVGTVDLAAALADVGPIYDEEAANAKNFGGASGSFDPTKDPAFDSVKTGRYATVGSGRGAGEGYRLPAHGKFREVGPPPIMGLTCDDAECKTVGKLDRFAVRDYVEKRYVDFLKCYERHARNAPRMELTLKFEIGSDGKPLEVYAEEPSAFNSCVVRIVERAKFPADKPTQVTAYPIAFWRT